MICQKCETENNVDATLCKNCGIELDNTNLPLSGGERVSIIVYFLILLGTSFPIGSGAIPLIVSLVMLYVIKTNKNLNSIGISYMIIVISCVFAAIGWGSSATHYSAEEYRYSPFTGVYTGLPSEVYLFATFSVLSIVLIFLSKILFFSVLERHKGWVIQNSLFTDTPIDVKKQSAIIGRDNLSTFSIADEMLKWNELLEKGLVSKEEFDEAKQKLLQQQK